MGIGMDVIIIEPKTCLETGHVVQEILFKGIYGDPRRERVRTERLIAVERKILHVGPESQRPLELVESLVLELEGPVELLFVKMSREEVIDTRLILRSRVFRMVIIHEVCVQFRLLYERAAHIEKASHFDRLSDLGNPGSSGRILGEPPIIVRRCARDSIVHPVVLRAETDHSKTPLIRVADPRFVRMIERLWDAAERKILDPVAIDSLRDANVLRMEAAS